MVPYSSQAVLKMRLEFTGTEVNEKVRASSIVSSQHAKFYYLLSVTIRNSELPSATPPFCRSSQPIQLIGCRLFEKMLGER
eukprot:416412-Amphidinium_carterae.1